MESFIQNLLNNPTNEAKEEYDKRVNEIEYSILCDAYKLPAKSQEFFNKKREAFAYRRNCAMLFLTKWVEKYGTPEGSPIAYRDTLIIPFQEIKKPK